MTYREFVNCYPWVDLVLELFKGIMPTLVALFAIFMNNSLNKKRDLNNRKKEMRLDCLEKTLSWIHEVKDGVFKTSQTFSKIFLEQNPEIRIQKYNDAKKVLSQMNTLVAQWNDTYDTMAKTLGYELRLDQFKESINSYAKRMIEIGKKSINEYGKNDILDEINESVKIVKDKTNENIKLIIEQINLLV